MEDALTKLISKLPADKRAVLAQLLQPKPEPIAVVGLSCRFPGEANDPDSYWALLKEGREGIVEIPQDRWDVDAFYDPNPDLESKMYTRHGGYITDLPQFDPTFFGISPREALLMDPQHRMLLEGCWQALEHGGISAETLNGSSTGIFVGISDNRHGLRQYLTDPSYVNDAFLATGNTNAAAAGRLAYWFNFQGPTMAIDTACSSSLVAIHLACQSLRNNECNTALAAGVNAIVLPSTVISFCKAGMLSVDGRCKTFDASADGFGYAEGCGVVVLKRMKDALADGNPILALIRGSAVNEDGRSNGLTAPNGLAQRNVIRAALKKADVAPSAVSYVETHGSGTALGDPIEVEALEAVYRSDGQADTPLYIGGVKTNLGHLNAAAGMAGFIKTVLALKNNVIPPHRNLQTLNPEILADQAKIAIPTVETAWQPIDGRRIAGVSSFGWAGTNAHVIIEEGVVIADASATEQPQLLVLSARTATALQKKSAEFATYLADTNESLHNIAHTLQTGRKRFDYRRFIVCQHADDAIRQLEHSGNVVHQQTALSPFVAFLFGDEVAQQAAISPKLYTTQPIFRAAFDECAIAFEQLLDQRLTLELLGSAETKQLQQAVAATRFAAEVALARLWQAWGIRPNALFGTGIGELVAAHLAGVISLDDAAHIICTRADLLQQIADGVYTQQMARAKFRAAFQPLTLQPPTLPLIATHSATWMTDAEATSPDYWANNILPTTLHLNGLETLLSQPDAILLDAGLSTKLTAVAHNHPARQTGQSIVSAASTDSVLDQHSVLTGLGQMWAAGCDLARQAGANADQQPHLVALPTYPFERQYYWNPKVYLPLSGDYQAGNSAKRDPQSWFYVPQWETVALPAADHDQPAAGTWLVLADEIGVADAFSAELSQSGHTIIRVDNGSDFVQHSKQHFTIRPSVAADFETILQHLSVADGQTLHVVHLWSLGNQALSDANAVGMFSLVYLARALGNRFADTPIQLATVTNGLQPLDGDAVFPEKATLLGPCRVIAQEYPNIRSRIIHLPNKLQQNLELAGKQLSSELQTENIFSDVAYSEQGRQQLTYQQHAMKSPSSTQVRPDGVYLITGGLGGVGLTLAKHFSTLGSPKLVLTSRSGLPDRASWPDWLTTHDAQDKTRRRIEQVQALEATGATVLVLAADAADVAAMRSVVDAIDAQFGALHGVIHAAGHVDADGFKALATLDEAACEVHFRPKITALQVLDTILADRPLDFCTLLSSLSSVLGGIGFTAYAAANSYMDAFVQAKHQQSQSSPWRTVNWDAWQSEQPTSDEQKVTAAMMAAGMTPEEGVQAFMYALASPQPQLVNSLSDLNQRIMRWVALDLAGPQSKGSHPTFERPQLATEYVAPSIDYEKRLALIWREALGLDSVGIYDNFFDLGGNSMIGVQLISRIRREFDAQINTVDLFESPTIHTLVQRLQSQLGQVDEQAALTNQRLRDRRQRARQRVNQPDVAIIGMAGRFPGADTVDAFWTNICNGVESIAQLSDEELLAAGIAPEMIADKDYVKVRPIIDGVDLFDAALFGYSPREAETLDPQHRIFLETAWQALELAGYNNTDSYSGKIGVYAGMGISSYLLGWITDSALAESVGKMQISISSDKDSLATATSYRLNLRGPSMSIQTYCSTSLVATHLARQSLLNGECDIVLAGGVTVMVPQKQGYIYQKGGQESPDGHCRTFDAKAEGSLFGDGAAVVVLKRLDDALEDGDTIHAVIKGSSVNNDGALKVGFTAPSVGGQADVVATALEDAGLSPETIGYIEAHGTATPLGDPIEVAALTQAYRQSTDLKQYCVIGSVKTNVGHLDRAAGATGLIKAALSVKHGVIPPTLHYTAPNPEIDFDNSPFYVTTELTKWRPADGAPRRAGINSLGVGGTNAHVIIEQPPALAVREATKPAQLLSWSARSKTALDLMTIQLADHLRSNPTAELADVAFTMHMGRRPLPYRRVLAAESIKDALYGLDSAETNTLFSAHAPQNTPSVVFMFPGVGDHYVQMARELYEQEPAFKQTLDHCSDQLESYLGASLQQLLYPELKPALNGSSNGNGQNGSLRAMVIGHSNDTGIVEPLQKTAVAQPLVFAIEYALARLLIDWGVRPESLIGYSLGEYVAACIAGVMTLEDALTLVAERARIIQALPTGKMLAVTLSVAEITPYLSKQINLAIHNGDRSVVVSGDADAIGQLAAQLRTQAIACVPLDTSHAFHSNMMAGAADALKAVLESITLNAPRVPFLSNVTGTWISAEEATSPSYWVQHMCQTVRFADGLDELLSDETRLLVEVGPGQALSSYARMAATGGRAQMQRIVSTMHYAHQHDGDRKLLLQTLGKLWAFGVSCDWTRYYEGQQCRRIPLPTYPFERKSYWLRYNKTTTPQAIDLATQTDDVDIAAFMQALPRQSLADWFYLPGWKQSIPHQADFSASEAPSTWLFFTNDSPLSQQLSEQMTALQQEMIFIRQGEAFAEQAEQGFVIRPNHPADYSSLLDSLQGAGHNNLRIIFQWSAAELAGSPTDATLDVALSNHFYSLLDLAQALSQRNISYTLDVVTCNAQSVTGNESLNPFAALAAGPCLSIPIEYVNVRCRWIDVVTPADDDWRAAKLIANLAGELTSTQTKDNVIALRGAQRWTQQFEPMPLAADDDDQPATLRQQGVYLITGGLGGIGLGMAETLASSVQAKLVLLGRSPMPPRSEWAALLDSAETDGGLKRKLAGVQRLETLGAEVALVQADVADASQLKRAVEQAIARFGSLHGVIHAAGLPGIGLIPSKTRTVVDATLAPKVQGVLALETALRNLELDFIVYFSSISSHTAGGPGQIDYCAANSFMDAYARYAQGRGRKAISINWCEWEWNGWDEGLDGFGTEFRDFLVSNRQRFGVKLNEGGDALLRILARPFPQVVVATQDYQQLVAGSRYFNIEQILSFGRKSNSTQAKHSRPDMGTSYVAPRNENERKLSAIWEDVLGISDIGIHDNFFELGGNSLVGLDLIRYVQKGFDIPALPANVLYEAPTVATMAELLHSDEGRKAVVSERHSRGAQRRERASQRKQKRKQKKREKAVS